MQACKLQERRKGEFLGYEPREPKPMDARGEVWTANRVAEVIARTFGVRYHRDPVGWLLREEG
jgi:transposase